jgi:DNA-binding response OmpR family regulator
MKKVLIIDDDPDILEAVEMILNSGGYEPIATMKGDETCQKVRDYKPDLIILDVLLSGNDGRKICKTLKHDERTKHIPIIMISAHPSASDTIIECGADSFIPKPFSVNRLLEEVAKYLR